MQTFWRLADFVDCRIRRQYKFSHWTRQPTLHWALLWILPQLFRTFRHADRIFQLNSTNGWNYLFVARQSLKMTLHQRCVRRPYDVIKGVQIWDFIEKSVNAEIDVNGNFSHTLSKTEEKVIYKIIYPKIWKYPHITWIFNFSYK